MKTEKIFSKNATYQKFEVLKTNRNKRYHYGEFFVEGVRNNNEAIKNHWQISSFLYTKEKKLSGWAEELLASVGTDINYELTSGLMTDLSILPSSAARRRKHGQDVHSRRGCAPRCAPCREKNPLVP
jgi:TrmH family RNA methyltransferase